MLWIALALRANLAAAETTSSLSWVRLDGAESCIAAPALARAVEERLGRTIFVPPSGAQLAVEGRVERGEGDVRWRAVLQLTDPAGAVIGDRVVESRAETCDELGRAAAITIALMIDPVGAEPEPPSELAAAPAVPRWRFGIDASLTGGWGAVPGVGVGGIGLVWVRPPGFVPVVAQGELVPFARTAGVDLARMVGGLQICPLAIAMEDVTLDGCVGVDAGVIFVLASDSPVSATEKVVVQAAGALHLRWRVVGPMVVRAGLHPVVPLRPIQFTTTDGAPLYTAAPLAAYADAGLGLTF